MHMCWSLNGYGGLASHGIPTHELLNMPRKRCFSILVLFLLTASRQSCQQNESTPGCANDKTLRTTRNEARICSKFHKHNYYHGLRDHRSNLGIVQLEKTVGLGALLKRCIEFSGLSALPHQITQCGMRSDMSRLRFLSPYPR